VILCISVFGPIWTDEDLTCEEEIKSWCFIKKSSIDL